MLPLTLTRFSDSKKDKERVCDSFNHQNLEQDMLYDVTPVALALTRGGDEQGSSQRRIRSQFHLDMTESFFILQTDKTRRFET